MNHTDERNIVIRLIISPKLVIVCNDDGNKHIKQSNFEHKQVGHEKHGRHRTILIVHLLIVIVKEHYAHQIKRRHVYRLEVTQSAAVYCEARHRIAEQYL